MSEQRRRGEPVLPEPVQAPKDDRYGRKYQTEGCRCDGFYYEQHMDVGCPFYRRYRPTLRDRIKAGIRGLRWYR